MMSSRTATSLTQADDDDVFRPDSPSYTCVVYNSNSRHTEVRLDSAHLHSLQDLHRALGKARKTLGRYVTNLMLGAALLVGVLLLSVVVVSRTNPSFYRNVYSRLTGGAGPTPEGGVRAGGSCESIATHMASRQCSTAGSGNCRLDAGTALCLLMETKVDLDARTKRLDEDVFSKNRQLEDLIPRQGKKNVSGVYSFTPSAHLYLYYSHEHSVWPRDHKKAANSFGPLRWTQGRGGLSSLREVDVTAQDDAILNIRIRHTGYYHVYSQVTLTSSLSKAHRARNWTKGRPLHFVYLRERHAGARRKLLVRSYDLLSASHVSYVQGVFWLKVNDTLTVLGPTDLLDTASKERTYFGIFRI